MSSTEFKQSRIGRALSLRLSIAAGDFKDPQHQGQRGRDWDDGFIAACRVVEEDLINSRFFSKVAKRGPDECWEWQGSRSTKGYGNFYAYGKRYVSSRFCLMLKLGRDLGSQMMACHTCDNPPCCNPAHLWEGTNRENLLDASAKRRTTNARKTHCNVGHPFAGTNLRITVSGNRVCQECQRARSRRSMQARRARRRAEKEARAHV